MDNQTLMIIILLAILSIISIALGIYFLIKYSKKRKKIDLIVGIILTFIIPGIAIYVAFKVYTGYGPGTIVAYGPNPGMVYGPGPIVTYGPAPA